MQSVTQPKHNHHLPWVEKYRPTRLDDIVHHKDIIHLLRVFMKQRDVPHLFFYGPPGTGKTSTILSVAKEIYGKYASTMVLHLNASDERGIDVVRKQIIQFASTTSMFGNVASLTKMVILDEADSMSRVAQIALRDVMISYDTLFCFIGNYQFAFQSQLQLRVIKLLFTPIPKNEAMRLGTNILKQEGYTCSADVLSKVHTSSGGDMRQFINLLQVITMRGHANSATNVFDADDVDTILCRWNKQEARQFVEQYLYPRGAKDCYYHLHECIVTTQESTLLSWLHALFDILFERSLCIAEATHQSPEETDSPLLTSTLQFCTEMATIESRMLHSLHPELQLYSMVAIVHRFGKQLRECAQSKT
jgi:DNA polymerase III delta prime subunit